jgi:hypothetical protein
MNHKVRHLKCGRWLAVVLSLSLVVPTSTWAQQQQPGATAQTLRILPLAGNNEANDLQKKVMAPLVVNVLDQNGRPVEGADVVFRFPVLGPSATFPNQQSNGTFRTDADGQAAATGWMANGMVGSFRVQILATRANETGETSIVMTNVAKAEDVPVKSQKSWWSNKWVKIAIIAGAGAAVGGTIWALQGGNGTAANNGGGGPAVVVGVPGSPTIGGPR